MLTGTLVTAAGFLPVGFAQVERRRIHQLDFWVVGLALVISWFVAVLFTPWIGLPPAADAQGRHAPRSRTAAGSTRRFRKLVGGA